MAGLRTSSILPRASFFLVHHPASCLLRGMQEDESMAKSVKQAMTRKSGRELIDTGTDKRYVRRRADGTFRESDDVGRSLAADRRTQAATKARKGQGDRGDR
jgi:hypothetical protein